MCKWDKVFKNGANKFAEDRLKQTISLQIF